MNKSAERLLSVSSVLKVLAPLAKKSVLYKKSKQREKRNNSKEKNSMWIDLIWGYYKLFMAEKVVVSLRRQ